MRPVDVLGIGILPLTVPALLDAVADGIREGGTTVAYTNAHVYNECARHPDLRAFLAGVDICYADGKGVVLAAQLLGHQLPGRMTGADWIEDLAARAAADGWRLAWLGGEPGVTARAASELAGRHPGLQVVLTEHGFHGPTEQAALVARLNAARPDLLLVGMGTPVQERWVRDHRDQLDIPVVWCTGATADFVSGEVSRGPASLHHEHEWLARLLVDPRRLWRRYLVGNPLFVARVLRQRWTGRIS